MVEAVSSRCILENKGLKIVICGEIEDLKRVITRMSVVPLCGGVLFPSRGEMGLPIAYSSALEKTPVIFVD